MSCSVVSVFMVVFVLVPVILLPAFFEQVIISQVVVIGAVGGGWRVGLI